MTNLKPVQDDAIKAAAQALVGGHTPPPVVIEHRRLDKPRLVDPDEAEALFKPHVIEVGG